MDQDGPAPEADLAVYTPNDDIPEEADDMSLSGNNTNSSLQAWNPPPRLAARFCRQSSASTRRKSSAASSRRNSISSTHSHQSNRSYHGGRSSQSNHVAQHLRRASIIESRKARLAERAAHAEQVRLRAALAKKTTTSRASNSEERAQAAQQAREKHLAQVAAACAEEVKRAKKVAEDMKERKAAEEKRYRLEVEERLAEAEKRRAEYKRNNMRRPRTGSGAAAAAGEVRKPVAQVALRLDDDTAAKRIQNAWRIKRRKQMFEAFFGLGLTIDRVRETNFEEMGVLLNEERVLSTTSRLLQLLHLQHEEDKTTMQTGTRNFLSAYLILGRPAEVLSSKDGDQEKDLINKAKDLMIGFESLLMKALASKIYAIDPTLQENLAMYHSAYLTAFTDWKARDASALIEGMVASFVSLDAIWQSVKDDTDGEVASDYKEGIRENQVILLSKIRKLAGPDRASMLIKKAIRESRKTKAARRKPVGDLRPRVAIETSMDEGSATGSNETVSATAAAASHIQHPTAAAEGLQASALTRLFSTVPPNRILVHELAIDKEYRIDTEPNSELRDAVNREVCDGMRKGFEQGEGNQWTVAMAENVRGKLLRLLKQGNSMYTLIAETLDPEFIQRQCAQGVFSYERFFGFMASILPKLCAPFRDEAVKALCDDLQEFGGLESMIEKLFKLLHVIDLLSLDYSNFLLMGAAPKLIEESAGYEQRMFAKDLQDGTITLHKTKCWWRNASVNILTEADRRDPLHRPTTQKIYAWGLVDLAIAAAPLQEKGIPETLRLDTTRLFHIRADAVRITTIGAILLTAKNLLKRDVRSQWKAEATRMWDALKFGGYSSSEDDNSSSMARKILSIIESSRPLPTATKDTLTSTIGRLLQQAEAGRLTDPVMKVLFQRLKTHILNQLSASSSGERVRAASTATEGLASSGLAEFVGQVGEIVDALTRVSEVDRKAHGVWYEQIASEAEGLGQREEEGGQSGEAS
ncbi:hypothetical protein LTS18_004259 [Coniosporium uncinatum]|uniref:Uncharacterized protein n=1 Tax=Coniosporium uncinatum TaxID=93489 RepID=A0ACC3E033_9PEZI|nr:hypothetical protein LTS18_004259 [Coniosporium uncinatum]